MTSWHGYEQHPDAHPERPWWRRGVVMGYEGAEGQGWVRPDGVGIVDEHNCSGYAPTDDTGACAGCSHRRWVHLQGGGGPAFDDWYRLTVEALMARIDAEHPLPAPEPRCGQVWCWPGGNDRDGAGCAALVCEVPGAEGAVVQLGAALQYKWPPTGAVLVAGPGAPWQDTSSLAALIPG